MNEHNIREWLPKAGLKITPQRIAVFEAVLSMRDHPTAEKIIEHVRNNHPNVAVGTIYNTLETFADKGLITKVKTDGDAMRYDAFTEIHHHLYSKLSSRIDDYYDEELNNMLSVYFKNKRIPGFRVDEVKVQIIGQFTDEL